MNYTVVKNYWKKKDAEGKKLENAKLKELIEAYIAAHDTMSLATSRDDIVNNTPVAYTYYRDNFYFLSEGGRKFANLEANKNVCCAIFDQMATGSCKGLQITGTAEVIEPDTEEYADYFKHIGKKPEDYSKNLEYPIPLVKITVKYLDYFDSTLSQQGYHSRQHLERREAEQ